MPAYNKADIQRRMHGAVEALKHDLGGLRTGRASTTLLDPVTVEVYGANMPINQVATVSAPEPRLLSVQVWDRSNVNAVEKAIRAAGLGLNPISDGQNHPPAHPRPDRGAAQGARQARPPICREGPDRRPQRPPRRHGGAQDRREEARDQPGRAQEARGRGPEADRRDDQGDRLGDGGQGKGNPAEVTVRSARATPESDGRRRRSASPGTSPSSWTATAAGRRRGACPAPPATARAPRRRARCFGRRARRGSNASPSTLSRPRTGAAPRTRSTT